MMSLKNYSFWFITGSQHLYGDEALRRVNGDSSEMAAYLDNALPFEVKFIPVVTTPEEISSVLESANTDKTCAGVITWMHTFSPSKMWITGLSALTKPLLHFHTQYNRDIPFDSIDMDFMNLNQSAHGDREHGFIGARMRLKRKVVSGYWKDSQVIRDIETWMRAAVGALESKRLKVVRFGDNMRQVAVTEGDKVEAQLKFGWSVNTYGVGDIVKLIENVSTGEIDSKIDEYRQNYELSTNNIESVREQAKYDIAIGKFLDEGGFGAFTTTFEDLHGLKQLPGLACQTLMQKGYGFGGEGDWKTASLVRIMKLMSAGMDKGTSFMEDYTYHLEPGNEFILGAHMLEVCPSIAASRPRIEVHPLGIGGKADPARLVFDGSKGDAICVTLVDMGDRFRMIVNEVSAVQPIAKMPKLPVARVMWKPEPSLKTASEAWIYAGGAHHTSFSYALNAEHMRDFAEIMGIEFILINKNTDINTFRKELIWNDIVWKNR